MREPVLSGEITREGMLPVIQDVERRRTTGVLVFEGDGVKGEVELVAGQIALEQNELPDGRDPVEALLELRSGKYDVYQRLPPLPVSKGDDLSRTGSLAVHVPADLMNYCEHAGMTGSLVLERDERRAEIVYDCGELVAIRVLGEDEQDLHAVFGWEEGTFHIQALSQRPPVPEPGAEDEPDAEPIPAAPKVPSVKPRVRDETGEQFLKTVEVALTDIVEEREKRRSPTRTSPPMPPPRRARPPTLPGLTAAPSPSEKPKKRRREPTVQVIYLSARSGVGEALPSARLGAATRHQTKDVTAEVVLPEASPERRAAERGGLEASGAGASTGSDPAARRVASDRAESPRSKSSSAPATDAARVDGPPPENPDDAPTIAGTLGWVLFVLALLVVAIGVLAALPPID